MDDIVRSTSKLKINNLSSTQILVNQYLSDWLYEEGIDVLRSFKDEVFSINQMEDMQSSTASLSINNLSKPLSPISNSNHNVPILSTNGIVNSPLDLLSNDNHSKSPKKRTQDDMLSSRKTTLNTTNTINHINSNIQSNEEYESSKNSITRRRSNFDHIPKFYTPISQRTSSSALLPSSSTSVPSNPNEATYFNFHLVRHDGTIPYSHAIKEDQLSLRYSEIEALFAPFPNGIPVENFVHITKKLYGVPSFFNLPLCKRINQLFPDIHNSSNTSNNMNQSLSNFSSYGNISSSSNTSPKLMLPMKRHTQGIIVKFKQFLKFWEYEIEPFNRIERFYRLIKSISNDFIVKDDFVIFLQELLHFHPGLDFLSSHEEFQRKYALTVITRIYYRVNLSRTGKITLRELRHSNLYTEFMHVDEETDINRVTEYFSYEHFYVLYCRFFELDMDKDSKLNKDDLLRYNDNALSNAIVDRIFQVGPRVFSDGLEGRYQSSGMTYPDFIFFMLAEEDRSSVAALRYWFHCCDLDGDGRLNTEEMWHFYRDQLLRVSNLGQEAIQYRDVICQMVDAISPMNNNAIEIDDLLKPEKRYISGILFDLLFNLHKFMRFETRDPFQEKQRREDHFQNDWDRFAYFEYMRLSNEDDAYEAEASVNNMDVDVRK